MSTTPEQQIADRDRAVRAAMFAVDSFAINNRVVLAQCPAATESRALVTAALGYLIGQGLITVTPTPDWPEYLPMDCPTHLLPDVAEMVAGNRALRDALFPGGVQQ